MPFVWRRSLLLFAVLNALHPTDSYANLPARLSPRNPGDSTEITTLVTLSGPCDVSLVEMPSPQELLHATESATSLEVDVEPEPLDFIAMHNVTGVKLAEYTSISFLHLAASRSLPQPVECVARILTSESLQDRWLHIFVFLFFFRYLRLVVHVIAFIRFKPKPVLQDPTFTAKDVSVIIPTVESRGDAFKECIRRVLANGPAEILIVTVGEESIRDATGYCKELGSSLRVLSVPAPSKREQVKRAVLEVRTAITVLCDDTVFWPGTLLPHILAPFEDQHVGIVGTCKRVRRVLGHFDMADFWNLCGAMRLERTNFDLASTNAIDGGVSCVSGRTCAVRSCILQDQTFLHEYTSEYIFWGRFGPLNAGDDKWLTRWVMKQGWTVFHQNSPEARIETILGVKGGGARFRGQCLRWARSSARDNPKMIFQDDLWRQYPWTTYAVLATSMVNYAALYDPLLLYALSKALNSPVISRSLGGTSRPLLVLIFWILVTKFVRPASHYWRHPRDFRYAPFIIAFGYYHSLIKLHALLTCWDISWGTRAGIDTAPNAA